MSEAAGCGARINGTRENEGWLELCGGRAWEYCGGFDELRSARELEVGLRKNCGRGAGATGPCVNAGPFCDTVGRMEAARGDVMGAGERLAPRETTGMDDLPDFAPWRESAWAAITTAVDRTTPTAHESAK